VRDEVAGIDGDGAEREADVGAEVAGAELEGIAEVRGRDVEGGRSAGG
jgi:hypothetical protein